jgi:hypothetical protein
MPLIAKNYPKDQKVTRVEAIDDDTCGVSWQVVEETIRSYGPDGTFWVKPRECIKRVLGHCYRVALQGEKPDTMMQHPTTKELLGLVLIQ